MIQNTLRTETIDKKLSLGKIDRQLPTVATPDACTFEIVEPTENDILLGRTRRAFTSNGNVRLREEIAAKLDAYNEAPSRREKTMVIRSVIKSVLASGGRFLKRVDPHVDVWCEASRTDARRRVGHAFRDACKPDKVKCMAALRKQIKSSKLPNTATVPLHKQLKSSQLPDTTTAYPAAEVGEDHDDESSATSVSSNSICLEEDPCEGFSTSLTSLTHALDLAIELEHTLSDPADSSSSVYDPLPIEKIRYRKPLLPIFSEEEIPQDPFVEPVKEWQEETNELSLDTVDMLLCAVWNEPSTF